MRGKILTISLVLTFLQPVNSFGYSNGDISEALAYSGCTWGMVLDSNQFGIAQLVKSNLEIGLGFRIIDEGLGVPSLEKADTPKGRAGYNHLLESWSAAGVLSTKWKSLESTYEKGLQAGLTKWKSGSNYGVSGNAAATAAAPKLVALCRIADIGVKNKASKLKLTAKQYVIKIAGNYLPPLP